MRYYCSTFLFANFQVYLIRNYSSHTSRKKQINKPKPISAEDMEAILQQAREEQEKADKAFEEEQKEERATLDPKNLNVVYIDSESTSKDVTESIIESKPKRRSRKTLQPAAGSAVRVVSGTFAEFTGILGKMDHKTGRVCACYYCLKHFHSNQLLCSGLHKFFKSISNLPQRDA